MNASSSNGAADGDVEVARPVNDTLLYHQTLIPTQNVTHAVEGSFTLPDANDIVLIRHNVLELWRLYAEDANGCIECICRTPLLSAVYAAVAVPTSAASMAKKHSSHGLAAANAGAPLDDAAGTAHRSGVHYLAVTSETGYVTLLRYQLDEPPVPTRLSYGGDDDELHHGGGGAGRGGGAPGSGGGGSGGGATATTMLVTTSLKGRFVKVSEVCLGRSGARLTVPGARMVVDPSGTALFLTALLRAKTLVPITANDAWDPVKGANVGDEDSGEDEGDDGSDGGDGDDEDDDEDDADDRQRRGPVTGRERRAARRRRAASARRANGAIVLGSPIEVQRQTVLYSVCALDGYLDHAVFAVLEEEVAEARDSASPTAAAAAAAVASGGTFLKGSAGAAAARGADGIEHHKHFVLYAYVPSLKQVQRTQLVHVPPTAHRLIAVPAAPYGPGGVLVCTDTELIWYDVSAAAQQQQESNPGRVGVFKCTYAFPRRMDCTELLYDPSIIQHTLTCFGRRFFLLLQDEQGDVYRVFLEAGDVQRAYEALRTRELLQQQQQHQQLLFANGSGSLPPLPPVPNPLAVHYFDTLPPSSAMALFRRGFLFLGSEAGPQHVVYKIKSNGYTADREYIVKRVRRERAAPALPPPTTTAAKPESAVKSETAAEAGGSAGERKRAHAGDDATASTAVKAEPLEDPTAPPSAAAAATTTTAMPPPMPRIKTEPAQEAEDANGNGNGSSSSAAPAAMRPPPLPPSAPAFKTPVEGRVIKVYQPHRRTQHVVQLQTLPNTPAITGFVAHLTSADPAGGSAAAESMEDPTSIHALGTGAGAAAGGAETSSEQPEIFFSYVGGRGAESTLVQARYGYAAKLEGRQLLPTVFNVVLPLPSALSMQALARQQQAAIEAAAAAAATSAQHRHGSAGNLTAAQQHAQRLKALRQLAATVNGARDQVSTDRVLLCTRQGTSVYRIGSAVEPDTRSSFITAERTLAATTLQHGCGYVQVTPRGIHVLGCADVPAATASSASVTPTSWTHPHGNAVLAAAVTPTTVLLSFSQRGGIASFDFGVTGTELQQRDVLPNFPLAPVVALLQPPASAVSAALQRELQALLWNANASSSSGGGGGGGSSASAAAVAAAAAAASAAAQTEQLAAIASITQEVYLVHPRKLREPLERIACRRGGSGSGSVEDGSAMGAAPGSGGTGDAVTITSLLLTYLGEARGGGGTDAAAALLGGGAAARSRTRGGGAAAAAQRRQLYLLVGHSDGVVTRCELNASSAKVTATAEVRCGTKPCQLVAGDGETFCYVVSGERTWRCEVLDGAVKMAPYSFPTRPSSFARFVLPSRAGGGGGDGGRSSGGGVTGMEETTGDEQQQDDGSDAVSSVIDTITLAPRERQKEVLIAVHHRELALYVSNTGAGGGGAGAAGGPGAGGVEYSFQHHVLPLAGRRLLQHPTRSAYLIVCGVEHRGHPRAEAERHRAADRDFLAARLAADADGGGAEGPRRALTEALLGGIPYTAPHRSLGRPNTYQSTLQLFHRDAQRLLAPVYFDANEAITCVVVGSFVKEFGREPVVIVGTASSFSHGAGCGTSPAWKHGFLRTFRCATSNAPGGGGGGGGDALLRLELLHSTFLRPDGDAAGAVAGAAAAATGGGKARAGRPSATTSAAAAALEDGGGGDDGRPDYPSALCLCEEVGLLFVGMGAAQGLRVYAWGREHLLRRRHLANTPGQRITAIDYVFASPPGSRAVNARNVSFFAADLYQCAYGDTEAMRLAREKQLLIVCGTANASIFIAALQPGSAAPAANGAASASGATPSFLLQVLTDSVPRHITSIVVVDERTVAAADRFGHVVFLRIPETTRTQFAQPVHQLLEAELLAEEAYLRTQQTFEEVARHDVGEVVTALHVQPHDPSHGTDPAQATAMVYYSTTLGRVGAYLPFLTEEDGAVAAYVQPLMQSHLRPLLGPPTALPPSSFRSHHIVDGDVAQLLRSGSGGSASAATTPFSAAAKEAVMEALERQVKMEAARRHVLGLPKRTLPSLAELIAKQRALLTLPL